MSLEPGKPASAPGVEELDGEGVADEGDEATRQDPELAVAPRLALQRGHETAVGDVPIGLATSAVVVALGSAGPSPAPVGTLVGGLVGYVPTCSPVPWAPGLERKLNWRAGGAQETRATIATATPSAARFHNGCSTRGCFIVTSIRFKSVERVRRRIGNS